MTLFWFVKANRTYTSNDPHKIRTYKNQNSFDKCMKSIGFPYFPTLVYYMNLDFILRSLLACSYVTSCVTALASLNLLLLLFFSKYTGPIFWRFFSETIFFTSYFVDLCLSRSTLFLVLAVQQTFPDVRKNKWKRIFYIQFKIHFPLNILTVTSSSTSYEFEL